MSELKYTCWGLAEKVDNTIYLNRNLQYQTYWGLRKRIIDDLDKDKAISVMGDKELMGFAISCPTSLLQLIPVSFRAGSICVNWWQVLSDTITIISISVAIYVGKIIL